MAFWATGTFVKAAIAGIFATTLGQTGPALAENFSVLAKYNISFLGLPVGRMKNSMTVSGDNYTISGGARTSGAVAVVAGVRASFASKGKISKGAVIPASFNVDFKTKKKTGKIGLNYKNGSISAVSATPKIKYKPGSVPVEKAHLRNVLDPLSSLLFTVADSEIGNGVSICNRTVPLFDGKARINLKFSYKSKSRARVEGFSGDVFHCAVRYQPVSGIRPNKKNIKFLKANRDMQVSVARIAGTNLYTLFGFNVATDKGRATGSAYYFVKK